MSNERAQHLDERYGFRVAGRLHGYYQDDGEDALVMITPVPEGGYLRQVDVLRARHAERYPDPWDV